MNGLAGGMLLALKEQKMPFRRNKLIPLLFLTVICLSTKSASAQEASAQEVETVFAGLVRPVDPGLAVLVKKDRQVRLEKSYGLRRIGTEETITTETNFRLASFTKQFTAMAIMLLIHDGKLRYETKLTEIFCRFPLMEKPSRCVTF